MFSLTDVNETPRLPRHPQPLYERERDRDKRDRARDRRYSCSIESGSKSHEAGSLTHQFCDAPVSWLVTMPASRRVISRGGRERGMGGGGKRRSKTSKSQPQLIPPLQTYDAITEMVTTVRFIKTGDKIHGRCEEKTGHAYERGGGEGCLEDGDDEFRGRMLSRGRGESGRGRRCGSPVSWGGWC